MAQIVYTAFDDASARDAAILNAMLAQWSAQSINLGPPNLRDEGCDVRTVKASDVHAPIQHVTYDGSPDTLAAPAWTLLTFTSGESMSLDNGGVGWTMGTSEFLRIRFGVEFNVYHTLITGSGSDTGAYSPVLYFAVNYYNKAAPGVPVTVSASIQEYQALETVNVPQNWATTGPPWPDANQEAPTYRDRAYLSWGLRGLGGGYDKVEIYYKVEAGTVGLWAANLSVEHFRR